jgi:hypothetical protein
MGSVASDCDSREKSCRGFQFTSRAVNVSRSARLLEEEPEACPRILYQCLLKPLVTQVRVDHPTLAGARRARCTLVGDMEGRVNGVGQLASAPNRIRDMSVLHLIFEDGV